MWAVISWVIGFIPKIVNGIIKKGRINEVDKIQSDSDTGNNASDDKRVQSVLDKYEADKKASS